MEAKQVHKHNSGGVSIGAGGISILAIFVVLCLTTLSALSMVSARADYVLAKKAAQAGAKYYAADCIAEETLADIQSCMASTDWLGALNQRGFYADIIENTAILRYTINIDSNNKRLAAEIHFALDDLGQPTGAWQRMKWQTEVMESYEGSEDTLNVFK